MSIKEYLKALPVNNQLFLSKDKKVHFHWADWETSALKLKEILIQNESSAQEYLYQIESCIDRLRDVPVWINHKGKINQFTLYDLYESLTGGPLKQFWEDNGDKTTVSTGSENGPFQSLLDKRWVCLSDYRYFVFKKMLTSYIPMRQFRIGIDLDINCSFNKSLNGVIFKTHKFTSRGFSLIVNGKNSIRILEKSKKGQIEFPSKLFAKLIENDDLISHLKTTSLNTNSKSNLSTHFFDVSKIEFWGGINFDNIDNYGIFIPYNALFSSDDKLNIKYILQTFTSKLYKEFTSEISEHISLEEKLLAA